MTDIMSVVCAQCGAQFAASDGVGCDACQQIFCAEHIDTHVCTESKKRRSPLTTPVSERQSIWLASGMLILFGASGFVDVALDDLSFPTVKIIALIIGIVIAMNQVRGGRKPPTPQ